MRIDILLGLAQGQGGLENAITMLSRELTRMGQTVRVLQTRSSPYPDWERDVPMHYYDPAAFGYAPRFAGEPDLIRWLLGYRALLAGEAPPDVILATHTPLFSLIARLAAGSGPTAPRVISWLHGPADVYGPSWPLRFADAHLAISHGVADSLRKALGQCPVHFIGNPINLDVEIIPRPAGTAEFIYLGRLEEQKRPELMLQALAKVQGPWHLSVFGDGALRPQLERRAGKLGLGRRIAWRGWHPQPWSEIREATALLLSSDYEGFGLVLAEALARGIPVVSTDIIGPSDFVRTGENGWLYPVRDAAELRRILGGIVSGKLALPAAEACRASVRDYAPSRVAARMLAAIGCANAFTGGF